MPESKRDRQSCEVEMENSHIMITGSNRGIGNAILRDLCKNGKNVIAHSRCVRDYFSENIYELSNKYQVDIRPVYFDMTDSEQMRKELKQIFSEKKQIDCLINCAGTALFSFFPLMKISEIRRIFDINLFSVMELTQLVVRQMIKRRKGCIVNISSTAGFDLKTNNSAYGVSKAALNAFTKELAMELGQFNIRVNAVAPGIVDTDMVKEIGESNYDMLISNSALNRAAIPEEISNVVRWLCSDEASYVNGQIIRADGGMI
ncbi:SDR family oxidoreductase [Lachnospiraceae bacterium 48-42]